MQHANNADYLSDCPLAMMIGAILMHLTILGISVRNDGGYLFMLALIVSLSSGYVLLINKAVALKEIKRLSGN